MTTGQGRRTDGPAKKPAAAKKSIRKKPTGKKATAKRPAAKKPASKSPAPVGTRSTTELRSDRVAALYGKYFLKASGRPGRGHDLGSDLGVANVVRAGVPAEAVDEAIKSGAVEPALMYDVVVARRTLAHRKSRDQTLTPDESDRLARVLRVCARAEDALGDPRRAYRWLRKENRALSGKTPLELLSSDAGARAVEKVLGRIEHGVYS
jgi:putative toxin-antitoxin system antitoxin component (TIGR02293 family)